MLGLIRVRVACGAAWSRSSNEVPRHRGPCRAKDDDVVCEVVDGGKPWGSISLVDDNDDEFSLAEIERFIARVVTTVTDNLWPDELTDPWPLCPTHRDHPLQPGMVNGRASWRCLQDDATVVPVGELSPVSGSPPFL